MRPRDRGAALMEAALVIPLLLLLVLGIADLGRAFAAQITLQDAVSEGALFGTKTPDDYALIRQRVEDSADVTLAPEDITVDCPTPKTVHVSATHDIEMITFVGRWFGTEITVTPEAVGTVITSSTCSPSPPP